MFPQITTVSYGRVCGKARKYRYWQACLYEYRPRKDGVFTARLVGTIGKAYRAEWKAKMNAIEYALANKIFYDNYMRQNQIIDGEAKKHLEDIKETMKFIDDCDPNEVVPFMEEFVNNY